MYDSASAMRLLRPVLPAAAVVAAVLAAGAAPASAAPPVCSTPPVKHLRTDVLAVFVPDCGLGSGPAAWSAVYTITDQPDHGTAQVQRDMIQRLRYLPPEGYEGPDQFSYTVTTADGTSTPVTQRIEVRADVNTPPTCGVPTPLKVRAGASRTFSVSCSDADGDALTLQVSQQPAHGQAALGGVTFSGRDLTVTMDAGYTGPDTLAVRAGDGRTLSAPATVALDVIAPTTNTAPTCWSDAGGPRPIRDRRNWVRTLACQDAEGDDVAIEVVTPPAHGTAEDAPPAAPGSWLGRDIAYTPSPGYTGPDSFVVRGRDARGAVSGTFTINVTVVEPTSSLSPLWCGTPSTVTVRAGGAKHIGGVCFGNGPQGYEVIAAPQHGTIVRDRGFLYTPRAGYTGPDSFSYRLLSASGAGPVVTQPISVVAGANAAPRCWVSLPGRGDSLTRDVVVRAGSQAEVAVSCSDEDGDPVTAQFDDPPHGAVTGFVPRAPGLWEMFAGSGTYRPDAGFVGFDRIAVTVTDGRGGVGAGATDFLVRPASFNSPPGCATLGAFPHLIIAGTEASYAEGCWDAEGDEVSMEVITPPQHVTFSPVRPDGRIPSRAVVRAPAGFTGSDGFQLTPVDERGGRGGLYGRSLQVIADPGPVDREVGRGETVGAEQYELPTPARPANVRLTTLNEGRVRINPKNGSAPAGWSAFGLAFDITAPDAIPEAPMLLRFRFDGSLRGPGESIGAITVFRNGAAVADCIGDGATPDPCVSSRTELASGDMEIVVLTSRASTWSFGRALPGSPPAGGTPGPLGGGPPPVVIAPSPILGQSEPPPSANPAVQPPLVRLGTPPKLGAALAKGVRLRVTSPFAGTARARLTLDARTAKRLRLSKRSVVVVATGSAKVVAGRQGALTLRFTPAARRALRRSRSVSFTLRVAVNDGPAATQRVRLRR